MILRIGSILIFSLSLRNDPGAVLKDSSLNPRPSEVRSVGFQRISREKSGLTFAHEIAAGRSLTNQMLLDGAGVALADADGDGRVDIFFGASSGQSQFWRNL